MNFSKSLFITLLSLIAGLSVQTSFCMKSTSFDSDGSDSYDLDNFSHLLVADDELEKLAADIGPSNLFLSPPDSFFYMERGEQESTLIAPAGFGIVKPQIVLIPEKDLEERIQYLLEDKVRIELKKTITVQSFIKTIKLFAPLWAWQ